MNNAEHIFSTFVDLWHNQQQNQTAYLKPESLGSLLLQMCELYLPWMSVPLKQCAEGIVFWPCAAKILCRWPELSHSASDKLVQRLSSQSVCSMSKGREVCVSITCKLWFLHQIVDYSTPWVFTGNSSSVLTISSKQVLIFNVIAFTLLFLKYFLVLSSGQPGLITLFTSDSPPSIIMLCI